MIHPLQSTDATSIDTLCYEIVPGDDELPAFDPLLMLKSVVLSTNSVKKFNFVVLKLKLVVFLSVIVGISLRFATFAASAPTGRFLAPIAATLHFPGMTFFEAGMRIDYAKIILRTFDFWFLQAANTLWAITLSVVTNDLRVSLVAVCWINFSNLLLQETYLRNTTFMIVYSLWEWMFNVFLMIWLSFGLLDDVQHCALVSTNGRTLSTKDLLANAMGTMTMLSLRILYRRYQHAKSQRRTQTSTMLALGYRCKIALNTVNCTSASATSSIVPREGVHPKRKRKESSRVDTNYLASRNTNYPPLQMRLATEARQFDPRKTVWPCIGRLTPLASWKLSTLYMCGGVGGLFAGFSLFLSKYIPNAGVIAAIGLLLSTLFSFGCVCCCQRQLLKRVVTSFHFLFLAGQMVAAGVCVMDMFCWRWISVCGVISTLCLAFTVLTIDALTPIMKRRLRFQFWMPVAAILFFWVAEVLLFVIVLVMDNWDLRDRVFLDLEIHGNRTQYHVAPFLLSRLVTIFVWSGRYAYVALTRLDDNALVLLRGEVEFDYEGWKKQIIRTPNK